jgi:hypothetical protein
MFCANSFADEINRDLTDINEAAETIKENSFLLDFNQFQQKMNKVLGSIEQMTMPVRSGSRRGQVLPINKVKQSLRQASYHFEESVRRLYLDFLIDHNQKVDVTLLNVYLSNIQTDFNRLILLIDKKALPFQVVVDVDELRETYLNFENKTASTLDLQTDQNAIRKSDIRSKEITFDNGNHLCWALSMPGDIILRKALLLNDSTEDDFGPSTMGWINFLESLKGNDQKLTYRHAEIITALPSANDIQSQSYYPWIFNLNKENEDKMPMFLHVTQDYHDYMLYRTKFTVLRVRALTKWGETRKKELALARVAIKQSYLRLGTCADFINWTYMHAITSNWNRLPILKLAAQMAYLPEGIQTPDNLADSYMTQKVCDVTNSNFDENQKIIVEDWLDRAISASHSINNEIKKHGLQVIQFMREKNIIDDQNQILVDVVLPRKFKLFEITNEQNTSDFEIGVTNENE